jgi:hypothetical protein
VLDVVAVCAVMVSAGMFSVVTAAAEARKARPTIIATSDLL